MDEIELAKVNQAISGHEYTHQASAALRTEFQGQEALPPEVASLVVALDYDSVEPNETDRRERWGPFAPMIETTEGSYPEALASTSTGVQVHWSIAASQLTDLRVLARLHDLLWELRYGSGSHLYGRTAIINYIDLATAAGPGNMDRSESLVRALEIARQLNDTELLTEISTVCLDTASDELASTEGVPGVSVRLLEALATLRQDQRPPGFAGLIDCALGRHGGDPWLAQNICDIGLSLGALTEARRSQLVDHQIQAWEEAAQRNAGLVGATHLERALQIAQRHGRSAKANQLRLRIQENGTSIELSEISSTVQIPRAEIEAYVNSFVAPNTLREALIKFAVHCPLPESRDKTAEYVQDLMQKHPLQYLFSKVVLGPGNLPFQVISTPEEHLASAMDSHEAMSIELWSVFAADILDKVREKFEPSRDEIRDLFAEYPLTAPVADRIAEAFELYWLGRHDSALMTVVPRFEAIVRALSQQIGLVIFVEPQNGRPGKFKGLGELVRALRGRFDERRRHYLLTLLANPTGYNLRNNALHGMIFSSTREQAAIALHAISTFTLVTLKTTEVGPDD